jgi:maleamate amidohydrolase
MCGPEIIGEVRFSRLQKNTEAIMANSFEDHCWKDLMSPEILEIYEPYQRETCIGQRPVLLAIDLYNLVFEGGPWPVHEVAKEFKSSCGIYAWNAIKPIQELLSLTRSLRIPIIYTTTETRKEARPGVVKATNRQPAKLDKNAFEIREEFKPQPGDLIVYKERASGFFGTPLVAHLTQLGADSLIVCGESTSGCVRASVVDAYSYGFHTVVVEECCFDRNLLSHKVNLFDLHHKYADVMHLGEVKKHLQQERPRRAL